jgi:hypothetical protein
MSPRPISRLLAACLVVQAFAACTGPLSDVIESDHPNVTAAHAAGAIGAGRWIPPIVPPDAMRIREVHSLDSNAAWGCFETQQLEAVRESLSRLNAEASDGVVDEGPPRMWAISWWPVAMRQDDGEVWEFSESNRVVRVGLRREQPAVCYVAKP